MANNDDIKVDDNISTGLMDKCDSMVIERIDIVEKEDTSDSKVDTPKQQQMQSETIQEQSSAHQSPISPQYNEPSTQSSIHTNINHTNSSLQSQVDTTTQSITHDMHKIKNESAISTLGYISDRDDYCKGESSIIHREEVVSEDSGTINKIKGWFSTSSEPQNADDDDDQSCASNYQNMATPDTDKIKRNTTTTDDDEEVIGKCSFFYNNAPISNEEDECYFDQLSTIEQYHRQQRSRLKHVAQAIKTQAKRQWTERRYRRRLRQSTQLGTTPYSIYNESTNINGSSSSNHDEFQYELSEEHRNAFAAAHAALNNQTSNEYTRNRHAIRKQYGYDNYNFSDEYDLELAQDDEPTSPGRDEIRADLTKSSLSIRGSGLIRLPADNVRLVCDSQLQPGILSIETRDVDGAKGYENYCNGNRYGNIHNSGIMMPSILSKKEKKNHKATRRRIRKQNGKDSPDYNNILRRQELAYVLTVDEQIYRRMVQEMGDAYRYPCGLYYCFHVTDDGNHVAIGVAVAILLVIFILLVVGMILWPTW